MKFRARGMVLALSLATFTGGWCLSAQADPASGSTKLGSATVPQPPHRPSLLKPQKRGIVVASSQIWDESLPVCARINCNGIFLSGIGF